MDVISLGCCGFLDMFLDIHLSFTQVFNLLGNLLALGVVSWKAFYDLRWNSRQYKREVNLGVDPITAATKKRNRSDWATSIAFIGLAISYFILIIGGF